jgi:RNA polymerase sigma factor (sigma-70 family)
MRWTEETLAAALHEAIQLATGQKGDPLPHAITAIVMSNLARGRVQYFLDSSENHQPAEYIRRVVEMYEKWHPYLYQIQEERSPDLWLTLYDQLKRWAYHVLSRKNYAVSPEERWQKAEDCATAAAIQLLNARFPYDTDFDPWAYVLLQTVTLKELHRQYAETAVDHRSIDHGDEEAGQWSQLSEPGPDNTVELRQALLKAVGHLASDARKQIILMHYFEQMSFPEIATALNRSVSAIHKLHFDALQNLRKIWID